MGLSLCLFEHRVEPSGALALPPANRIVYVVNGGARATAETAMASLGVNAAWCGPGAVTVDCPLGGTLLRFELQRDGAGDRSGRLILEAPLDLDPAGEYLMRGDRVDFPVGGVAFLHRHEGPGIRRLLHGHIRIETQGKTHPIEPGEAWFETGPDPVFAATSDKVESAFVRCMVLPRRLKGRSSISYVDPADKDKPKTQRYQVFIDFPIQL